MDERRPRRAPDRLRHLLRGGAAPCRRVRRRLARVARHRGRADEPRGLPVTTAEVGPADAPTLVLHGHLDVVPGGRGQFEPRVDGRPPLGRGAYDMKGALAVMLIAAPRPARPGQGAAAAGHRLRRGVRGGGEPRQRRPRRRAASSATSRSPASRRTSRSGCRRRACWRCASRSGAARRTAPRRGSATTRSVKAVEVFRGIESLPFARHSSALFDRPSINLGRIWGGDALNKVPDTCVIDVDIRFLPDQDPEEILEQVVGAAGHHGADDVQAPAGRGRGRVPVRARASARPPRPTIPSG